MQVSIVGATGYTGIELVRLIKNHPRAEIALLTSENFAGERIADIYPHLSDIIDSRCQQVDADDIAECSDMVFTALPHGVSSKLVPDLLEKGLQVIDLSGDYRYQNPDIYREWYQKHENPDLMARATYGLAEIREEQIKNSRLIANPGCYPTSSLIPLYPFLAEGIINSETEIIIDAKSGVTGAGRKPSRKKHFCEVQENFQAYSVEGHRHRSEIAEKLKNWTEYSAEITFTPHLLPLKRGILTTIYSSCGQQYEQKSLVSLYEDYYSENRFIRIFTEKKPQLKYVTGTNFCDISVTRLSSGRLKIISALDNLIKGAAGQAVQNMNLLCSWPTELGLDDIGLYL